MRKRILLFIVIAGLMQPFNGRAQAVNVSDSLALVDFFKTDSSWWASWPATQPISKWYGIVVKDGRITEINFGFRYFHGYIPASFGNLTALTVLNLGADELKSLPPSMNKLVNLTKLTLLGCHLTGSFPPFILNLTHLQLLDITESIY